MKERVSERELETKKLISRNVIPGFRRHDESSRVFPTGAFSRLPRISKRDNFFHRLPLAALSQNLLN